MTFVIFHPPQRRSQHLWISQVPAAHCNGLPDTANHQPMKTYKFCQSCGYPMKKDKQGGGTEKDGTRSARYCSMCYQDGRFLSPPEVDTAEKMQKFCISQMKKSGINGLLAWLATRSIPRLERWKKVSA